SAQALDWVEQNAALNGVAENVQCWEGDAFAALRQLKDNGERFDVVVMDPPALIPKRKDIKAGEQAYHRLNSLAMRLLSKDGLLVAASCSMHLGEERLPDMLRIMGRELDRDVLIQHIGSQGADHPVVPAIPETRYLKAVFARVLPTRRGLAVRLLRWAVTEYRVTACPEHRRCVAVATAVQSGVAGTAGVPARCHPAVASRLGWHQSNPVAVSRLVAMPGRGCAAPSPGRWGLRCCCPVQIKDGYHSQWRGHLPSCCC